VLAGILLLVALTVGALALWRRSPLVTVGWLWFLVTIAPESSLVPIRDLMVEHRLYLPLAGLAWAPAAPLAAFAARGTRHWLVPAALVAVLAVVTHLRNRVWRDEVTLWADVTARAPAQPRGYNNYGMALEAEGRVGEAEAAYRRAIGLDSSYVYGLVNLGRLLGMQGRYRDGLEVLLHAERLAPDGVEVQNDLGNTWLALGDTARAAAAYRHALVADPAAREPAANLGRLRGPPRP
jgi:tetratricopeptide (TPR) repeat protein